MTLLQLAGRKPEALALSLPAATTTVVPRDTAPLIAFWYGGAAGAAAAEAHVDDLGRVGVGGHAGDGAAGRPDDGVGDVGE